MEYIWNAISLYPIVGCHRSIRYIGWFSRSNFVTYICSYTILLVAKINLQYLFTRIFWPKLILGLLGIPIWKYLLFSRDLSEVPLKSIVFRLRKSTRYFYLQFFERLWHFGENPGGSAEFRLKSSVFSGSDFPRLHRKFCGRFRLKNSVFSDSDFPGWTGKYAGGSVRLVLVSPVEPGAHPYI